MGFCTPKRTIMDSKKKGLPSASVREIIPLPIQIIPMEDIIDQLKVDIE